MILGKSRFAFSLIEVTLALGIASFGLLAVAGLLPVGLNSVKASREEAAAAKCLEQMSIAVRGAALGSDGVYRVGGAFSDLSWEQNGATVTPASYSDISLGGFRTTDVLDQRLAARVEVVSPDGSKPGRALVSVAWPKQATWDASQKKWVNASGSVSTWLTLMPQ